MRESFGLRDESFVKTPSSGSADLAAGRGDHSHASALVNFISDSPHTTHRGALMKMTAPPGSDPAASSSMPAAIFDSSAASSARCAAVMPRGLCSLPLAPPSASSQDHVFGRALYAAAIARASSGVVTLLKDFSVDIKGQTVLLVDDVLDTGRSLHFGKGMIEDRGAKDVKLCVFVKKLTGHAEDLKCDYIGFEAQADDFLVGYGMDDDGRKRGLPLLGSAN